MSEADPALELPEDDRWAAGIYGKVRDHSAALREGICETLVILSVHGNNLFKDRLGIDVDGRVGGLIERLLTPLTLDKLMSHERDLPRYAEAAPEDVPQASGSRSENGRAGRSRSCCKPASTGIFGSCPRTGSALGARMSRVETAEPLPRVAAILARLSRTTINDNWANKPIGSLEAIFRSWMPQTAASLEERCKALELLTKRYPDIGWQICIEQFSPGYAHGRLQLPSALAQRRVRRGPARRDAKGDLRVLARRRSTSRSPGRTTTKTRSAIWSSAWAAWRRRTTPRFGS